MRSRTILLAAATAVAGLAVFRTVAAQSPPGLGVPPKAGPAGGTPQPAARPAGEWTPNTPGQTGAARPNTGRPRLTNPVVAGPDGVRPAGGFDLPPPNLELPAPPAPGGASPPNPGEPKPPPPALPPLGPPEVRPVTPAGPSAPPAPVPPQVHQGGGLLPVLPAGPAKNDTGVSPGLVRPSAAGGVPAKVTQSVVVEAACPESVAFGAEFRYELVVKNQGTAAVAGIRVEDAVPAGARYVGSDPPAEQSGDRLTWAVGTLEPGTEKRIAVRVKPADEGEVVSRAVVTYSATVDVRTRVTRPRLAVAVTAPEVCKAGEQATFKIKITNAGSGPAQKLVLQGFLSDGLVHSHGSKLEMQVDSLPAGETKTVDLPATAGKAGAQWCQVVVTAPGSADATAKAAVSVVEPLLQVKQTGPAKCLVRAEPEYAISLSNPGTAATDAVTLYTILPDGFEFVQAGDSGAYTPANRAVVWNLAGLAPGGSKSFTLKLRAASAGEGVLRTIAQSGREQPAPGVTGAGGAAGVRPAEKVLKATAETPVKAEGVAAVRFEVIDLEDPIEVGKEAVYEIKVTNQGTGACTNVQLAAAMAEGAAYTGSSGPTQIKVQGQHLIFEPIATLAVKGEAVYRVKVRGTQAGDVRFRVQLTCDQVPNPVVKEESTRFVKE